jgi:thiamine biosynthesis lipoprotein
MTKVFESMGTVVSLEPPRRFVDVQSIFRAFDERFSLFRSESEISRLAGGSLALLNASEELRSAYARALEWRSLTAGAFTPHRPDGVIDLSGIVKALAMEAAGDRLTDTGGWILNAGGDVLVGGRWVANGKAVVGIVDPHDRSQLLTSVKLDGCRRAVATSGTAERGEHIWGSGGFAQVTVVANDIVTADVLATAIVAGGAEALNAFTTTWDIDVLAVDSAGQLRATPGFTAGIHAVSTNQAGLEDVVAG